MDAGEHRCKSCGIVFDYPDGKIDECTKKRLYCEICLAQKNPKSTTEQKIKKKYIQFTAIAALAILVLFVAINWGKNKYDTPFEYLFGFGFGFLIIWAFTAFLGMPFLLVMKKPHKMTIRQEKEKFIEELEEKKVARDIQLGQQGQVQQ